MRLRKDSSEALCSTRMSVHPDEGSMGRAPRGTMVRKTSQRPTGPGIIRLRVPKRPETTRTASLSSIRAGLVYRDVTRW